MTEFRFPYGDSKVFASIEGEKVAWSQGRQPAPKEEKQKIIDEITSRMSQYGQKQVNVFYNACNHPEIVDFLNKVLTNLSERGFNFRLYSIGPQGSRLKHSLSLLNEPFRTALQVPDQVAGAHAGDGPCLHMGFALPSAAFGISGMGECLVDVARDHLSEVFLDAIVQRERAKCSDSLRLIASLQDSFMEMLSLVFMPSDEEGIYGARMGSLSEVAEAVVSVFKDCYLMPDLGADRIIAALGGTPYDTSVSDSLDLLASVTALGQSKDYCFIAEWGDGLGDYGLLHSFRKDVKELRRQVLERFNWSDFTAYVIKASDSIRGASMLTALPQAYLKRITGGKRFETANRLAQRLLRTGDDKGIVVIDSIPRLLPRSLVM